MITLSFAELHTPLFLSGSNLGVKLTPGVRGGMKLFYGGVNGPLYVVWNGKLAIVPEANVSNATPENYEDVESLIDFKFGVKPEVKAPERVTTKGAPMRVGVAHTAQVETPHSRGK